MLCVEQSVPSRNAAWLASSSCFSSSNIECLPSRSLLSSPPPLHALHQSIVFQLHLWMHCINPFLFISQSGMPCINQPVFHFPMLHALYPTIYFHLLTLNALQVEVSFHLPPAACLAPVSCFSDPPVDGLHQAVSLHLPESNALHQSVSFYFLTLHACHQSIHFQLQTLNALQMEISFHPPTACLGPVIYFSDPPADGLHQWVSLHFTKWNALNPSVSLHMSMLRISLAWKVSFFSFPKVACLASNNWFHPQLLHALHQARLI